MVASMLALSVLTRLRASSMISCGRPSRSEMAKALDLPGMPMSRWYVGRRESTSNSHEAFMTPGCVVA